MKFEAVARLAKANNPVFAVDNSATEISLKTAKIIRRWWADWSIIDVGPTY